MKLREKEFLDEYCRGRTLEECFEMRKKINGDE
ncbi:hypothetical protein AciM339_0207 [Aciduliprofundum sp. MAR08-339]|nr:hypothetical protein AciM339_0174 [Aciduliprofundum sp. MAR08-339]AGB04104.1 hypothetical protein AciM339_0207 [Aciduliprofundum sp. MAR08-339]